MLRFFFEMSRFFFEISTKFRLSNKADMTFHTDYRSTDFSGISSKYQRLQAFLLIFWEISRYFRKSNDHLQSMSQFLPAVPSISIFCLQCPTPCHKAEIFQPMLLQGFEPRPKDFGSSLVTIGPSSLLLIYIHNKYVKVHY